jgi:hypothetical protein
MGVDSKDEDKGRNGGMRVGCMRSAALAGTDVDGHRPRRDALVPNGASERLLCVRNKVGADVMRLVYIYLARQGIVLQNTRPNIIRRGLEWEIGRSSVKIWGSLLNLDITTRAFLSTVKRFPFPSPPPIFLFPLNIPLRPPAATSQALAFEYSPGLFFRKFTWSETAFGRREADRIKISCLV